MSHANAESKMMQCLIAVVWLLAQQSVAQPVDDQPCFGPSRFAVADGCSPSGEGVSDSPAAGELPDPAPKPVRLAGWVMGLRFHDGGKLQAAYSDRSRFSVAVWDLSTGRPTLGVSGKSELKSSFSFSDDGRYMAVQTSDCVAEVWDLDAKKRIHRLQFAPYSVESLAFDPKNRWVIAAGSILDPGPLTKKGLQQARAVVYELRTGQTIREWDTGLHLTGGVAVSPSGESIAVAGTLFDDEARFQAVVSVWESGTGKNIASRRWDSRNARSIAFSPDARNLLIGFASKVAVWEWRQDRSSDIKAECHFVDCVGFSRCGQAGAGGHQGIVRMRRFLGSRWGEGEAIVWDTQQEAHVRKLLGIRGHVMSLSFSRDGTHVATGSSQGDIRIWDTGSGVEIVRMLALRQEDQEHWVTMTREGYFDASEMGKGLARWLAESKMSADDYVQKYHNREHLLQVLKTAFQNPARKERGKGCPSQ